MDGSLDGESSYKRLLRASRQACHSDDCQQPLRLVSFGRCYHLSSTVPETRMATETHPTDTGSRVEKGWVAYGLVVALLVLVGVVLWSRNGVAVFSEVMTAFLALCF